MLPLLLAAALVADVSNQNLVAGTRLRVQHDRQPREVGNRVFMKERTVGFLVSANDDEMVVLTDRGVKETLPLENVTGVERYTGTHRHVIQGTIVGAALGTLLAVPMVNYASTEYKFMWAVIMIAPPTALGATIGYSLKSEEWESVGNYHVDVGLSPDPEYPIAVSYTVDF